MSNMPPKISPVAVKLIVDFIKENSEYLYNGHTPPFGKGIFNIIEKKAIVFYYPIMDVKEKNDAFLLSKVPLKNGEIKDVIFINTYQTFEKQVFAAAHELGHLLNVPGYVNEQVEKKENEELIVNRFAAEYLMPKQPFIDFFLKEFHNTFE